MNLEFCKSDDTMVGLLCVRLIIRNARTLKGKRRVIKSLKDRVKNNFNVSISETGVLDHCQYSSLGIAMVGNDKQYVNSTLSNLLNMFKGATSFELAGYHLEFMHSQS
ncbi:MAG: DUF503 domain-containing protein [Candidatus Kuenenia sp.]|nr:DUF503 domain-containing protein [Candidatus Kuenenia hertensis]